VAFVAGVAWFVAVRQRAGAASRPGGVLGALAAVGQRSLTCYLLQSVLFVPVMAPWAGGLGSARARPSRRRWPSGCTS